jgi:hypothetical protein
MLGDHRKHKEHLEKIHFHPQKIFFWIFLVRDCTKTWLPGTNLNTKRCLTRTNLCTKQCRPETNLSTKPCLPGKKTHLVPGRHVLVMRFVPGRHHLVQRFVPGKHILVQTITRNFQFSLGDRIPIKDFKVFTFFITVTFYYNLEYKFILIGRLDQISI